jgi:hypothetical protein
MVWTQEEIDAFKARRAQGEGNLGKVDDFVCADQARSSPTRTSFSGTRKWKATPTDENRRVDDWLGASPTGQRRSWKVKSVKPVVPDL